MNLTCWFFKSSLVQKWPTCKVGNEERRVMQYDPYVLPLFKTPYWLPVLRNSLLFDVCHCPFPFPFVPLTFINFITGTQLTPLKILGHAPCSSTFVPMGPHLENSSVFCLSHRLRISTIYAACPSKLNSKATFQGCFFDHLSWKEPYLSLNFQRIAYGSDYILLCIIAVSAISQRWDLMFWSWICFILCFL